MSHRPQAAGIHDWYFSKGHLQLAEEPDPRFAKAALEYKVGAASREIPSYAVPSAAARAAQRAAMKTKVLSTIVSSSSKADDDASARKEALGKAEMWSLY